MPCREIFHPMNTAVAPNVKGKASPTDLVFDPTLAHWGFAGSWPTSTLSLGELASGPFALEIEAPRSPNGAAYS